MSIKVWQPHRPIIGAAELFVEAQAYGNGVLTQPGRFINIKTEHGDTLFRDLHDEYNANNSVTSRYEITTDLPEAPLIAELARQSAKQTEVMIEQEGTSAWTKTAKSLMVKEKQKTLRDKARQT